MSVSERIRARLVSRGVGFAANANISSAIGEGEMDLLQLEVEEKVRALLSSLVIDAESDHNSKGTAHRVAKLFLREVMRGRYEPRPEVTDFPNVSALDQLYIVGPITVRSMCSHHLVPIIGRVWVGVIPTERVIGLSKFTRLAEWVMSRPQIQEEATVQLADLLVELIRPKGLALIVRAAHMCMSWRGVRDTATEMVTSVMKGAFMDNVAARTEFLSLVHGGS